MASPIWPAAWSRDGQTIFGTEYPETTGQTPAGKITACASHGPCRVLADGYLGTPSSDDSRVFFLRIVRPGRNERELWSVDADGDNLRKVAVFGPWGDRNLEFDVSPDNRILRPRPQSSDHRLWLADLR